MTKWDRFDSAIRRAHDDFEFRDLIVYNATRSLDSAGRANWSDDSGTTVQGEVREPRTPRVTRAGAGEESEADAEIWLRDDHGATITPTGTEDERGTVIEDPQSETRYQVTEQFDEDNGLVRLTAVEQ